LIPFPFWLHIRLKFLLLLRCRFTGGENEDPVSVPQNGVLRAVSEHVGQGVL